ncbi:MAG: hypothetical protein ISS55_04835 [Dehalococcoidales bacterium]|nr:hypothetical protein [Dehalococcoidales bacterium]
MDLEEAELDWSPLIAIDHLHANRYGTVKLLEVLFNKFDQFFPNISRNTQFQGRAYIEIMIAELACQYVEDVACYSLACKETGLLYMERVLSVTPTEVADFYSNLNQLTHEDIRNIFNIHHEQTSALDYSGIGERYEKLQQFRGQYHGFHNAIKHGWRFRVSEISTKDKPMTSLHGTYVDFQWIKVGQGRPQLVKVKAWDGSETEIGIKKRNQDGVLLPCDDISPFVNVAQQCYTIIEDILKGHSPPAHDG